MDIIMDTNPQSISNLSLTSSGDSMVVVGSGNVSGSVNVRGNGTDAEVGLTSGLYEGLVDDGLGISIGGGLLYGIGGLLWIGGLNNGMRAGLGGGLGGTTGGGLQIPTIHIF